MMFRMPLAFVTTGAADVRADFQHLPNELLIRACTA
jgi:hypothetical protein